MRNLIVLTLVVACMAVGGHSFRLNGQAGAHIGVLGGADEVYNPEDEPVARQVQQGITGGLTKVKAALVSGAKAVRSAKIEAAKAARDVVVNGIAAKRARIAEVIKTIGASTSGLFNNQGPRDTASSLLSGVVHQVQNHVAQKKKLLSGILPVWRPTGATGSDPIVPIGNNLYQIETYESDEPNVIGKIILRQKPFDIVSDEQAAGYRYRRPVDTYGSATTSYGTPADSYGPPVTA